VTYGRYKTRDGCREYSCGHQKADWLFLILSLLVLLPDNIVRTCPPWHGLTGGYILVPAYLYIEGKYKKQHNQLSSVSYALFATAVPYLISVF